MAIYQPIRDAFKDFNQMIVDSQQWDQQHAATEHSRKLDHLKLVNGMEQQAFNNVMAKEQLKLQLAGENRAAKALEQKILHNNRMFNLADDRLEFDIMSTNRQFGINSKTSNANIAAANERIEKSKIEREKISLAVQQTKELNAIKPALMQKAKEEIFTDPLVKAQNDLDEIRNQIKDIDNELKHTDPNNTKRGPERAFLRASRNGLLGAARRVQASVTPDALIKGKQARAEKAKAMAAEYFDKNDDESGQFYMDLATSFTNDAIELWDITHNPKRQGEGGTKKDYTMKSSQFITDLITPQRTLIPAEAEQNAANEQAQIIFNEYLSQEGATVDTEAKAVQLAMVVLEDLEDEHNKLAKEYIDMQSKMKNIDKFNLWVKESYLPRVEKAGFKYAPVELYKGQVRKVD